MIKRKNVLAENMLRFGPKNLTKSQVAALRRLTEQTGTEIDVLAAMPKGSAALSMKFNMAHAKNTAKVTGIIGPYYLTSDSMSDDGYDGAVFAFESVTLGGSRDTGAMTLPIPAASGRFVWQRLLAGTDGPGFNYIDIFKTTAKSMTDSNATRASVAKIINELYNRIPLRDLRAIYDKDTNKPSYDEMISNFKTIDSQRNEKIGPLLTGNAKEVFVNEFFA